MLLKNSLIKISNYLLIAKKILRPKLIHHPRVSNDNPSKRNEVQIIKKLKIKMVKISSKSTRKVNRFCQVN